MPRVTRRQKVDHALHFLMMVGDDGLRIPLLRAGYTDRDNEEGWRLLRATGPSTVGEDTEKAEDERRAADAELDELGKRYFMLAEPAIARRYPEAHAVLYGGTMALTGKQAIVGIPVFLEALRTATKTKGMADARKLLRERGLTDEVIAHATKLVSRARGVRVPVTAAPPHDQDKAVDALWAWFSEWAAVARKTVHDRRILQRLDLVGDAKDPTHADE